MARDISKIRQLAEQRENPDSHLVARPQKTISSLRVQQIRQDPETQIVLDKVGTSKKLSKSIEKKREELKTIAEAAKSIVEGANAEADRIVDEVKEKASKLISQAKSDAEQAKISLEANKIKEKELLTWNEQLEQREKKIETKESLIETKEKDFHKKQEDVDKLLESASERETKSVDIFASTLALFELVFEQAKQLQNLNSEAVGDVSQTLVKTGTMIERIAMLVKSVDEGNSANIAKAQELQEWQEGLIDRERTLDRTAKEVEKMKGQN